MSNGTTVPIFISDVHKRNAAFVKAEAEHSIDMITKQLIAMAASSGGPVDEMPWHQYVTHEVSELVEQLAEESFRALMASRILDCPDDCHDDLEPVKPGSKDDVITRLQRWHSLAECDCTPEQCGCMRCDLEKVIKYVEAT